MVAAASQLCVRQVSTLLHGLFHPPQKAVKLNRFHLFFVYISTSFSSSEEHLFCSMPTWHAKYTVQISIYTEYGSGLMAKKEKSTFQISSLLLSSFISNIYTPEKRLLLAKSAKQSEGKGVSRSQLQCQATIALRKCEHQGR